MKVATQFSDCTRKIRKKKWIKIMEMGITENIFRYRNDKLY